LGTLADEVTARARISPASVDRISPVAVADRAVVTAAPNRRGAPVVPGTLLLVVNGRPLFALPGRFPFYRDITDGMTGPDVEQLQVGVVQAGFMTVGADPTGRYGQATQAALRALYESVGAEPVTRPGPAPPPRRTGRKATQPPAPELPIMPLTEFVVAPRLPATLSGSLRVGASVEPSRPVATLTSGSLVAHAAVASSVVGRIRPGMRATLSSRRARPFNARVLAIHGPGSAPDGMRDVTIGVPGGSLPARWRGRAVLVRITTALVHRRALIVPTRAVAQDPDGRSYLLKQVQGNQFSRVAVRTLGTLAGRTAVEPVTARALLASDRVRVG
jgi:hypothetical protein